MFPLNLLVNKIGYNLLCGIDYKDYKDLKISLRYVKSSLKLNIDTCYTIYYKVINHTCLSHFFSSIMQLFKI